eukprot:s1194_g10.t1
MSPRELARRLEVAEAVESNQLNVSSKLELLHTRVQSLANSEHTKQAHSHESRGFDQNEASRKLVMRREETLQQLSLVNVSLRKSDMDLCMQHLAGKIDVQKMLDVQTMNLMQKIREIQLNSPDLSVTLQARPSPSPVRLASHR